MISYSEVATDQFGGNEAASHAIRLSVLENLLANATTATVSVRSVPRDTMSDELVTGTSEEEETAQQTQPTTRFRFYGRVLQIDGKDIDVSMMNPDECDIDKGTPVKKEELAKFVALYPEFESTESNASLPPSLYDVVKVTLSPTRGGETFDRQYGFFDGLVHLRDGADIMTSKSCESIAQLIWGDAGTMSATGGGAAKTGTYIGGGENMPVINGSLASANLIQRATGGTCTKCRKPKILKDTVESWNKLVVAFEAKFPGKYLGGSGDRTFQAQVDAKARWTAKGKPEYAATPGTSKHGWGVAIDIKIYDQDDGNARAATEYSSDEYKWLLTNAPKYDWENPIWARKKGTCGGCGSLEEPWHWEYTKRNELIRVNR